MKHWTFPSTFDLLGLLSLCISLELSFPIIIVVSCTSSPPCLFHSTQFIVFPLGATIYTLQIINVRYVSRPPMPANTSRVSTEHESFLHIISRARRELTISAGRPLIMFRNISLLWSAMDVRKRSSKSETFRRLFTKKKKKSNSFNKLGEVSGSISLPYPLLFWMIIHILCNWLIDGVLRYHNLTNRQMRMKRVITWILVRRRGIHALQPAN